jgi:hypothetical protein
MKLQMPPLDAHPLDRAIFFAKRAGLQSFKVKEYHINQIVEDYKGDIPLTKDDLIGSQQSMIGRNSSHEWWGIVTPSGRRILWIVGYYDDGYEGDSRDITDSKNLPSYIGHF